MRASGALVPGAVAADDFQQRVGRGIAVAIAHQPRRQFEARFMIVGIGRDLAFQSRQVGRGTSVALQRDGGAGLVDRGLPGDVGGQALDQRLGRIELAQRDQRARVQPVDEAFRPRGREAALPAHRAPMAISGATSCLSAFSSDSIGS